MTKVNIKSFITGILFTLSMLTFLGMKSYYDIDDVMSKLNDIESTISNLESTVSDIEDNIGGEYDYGSVLYKLREIESTVGDIKNGVECDGGYIDGVNSSVDCY